MEYNDVEREVLSRLGRKSFSHIKKDDIIKFAAMMPEFPPDHVLKIIEQFPEFTRFALAALDQIENAHRASLESNQHSQDRFHEACKELRAIVKRQLDRDDLSPEERLHGWDLLVQILSLESAKDSENKQFLERMAAAKVGSVVVGVVVAGLVLVGGKAALESVTKAVADGGLKALAKGGVRAAIGGAGKAGSV